MLPNELNKEGTHRPTWMRDNMDKRLKFLCTSEAVYRPPTHGRDPITARYGCFWLLDCSSGPVHTSLDNLVTPSYPGVAILILSLMRTPTQHERTCNRTPHCKLFLNQTSQKQDYRASPQTPAVKSEERNQVYIPDEPENKIFFFYVLWYNYLILVI